MFEQNSELAYWQTHYAVSSGVSSLPTVDKTSYHGAPPAQEPVILTDCFLPEPEARRAGCGESKVRKDIVFAILSKSSMGKAASPKP